MDGDLLSQFCAITDASRQKAVNYLRVSDMNLQQAIQLYFDTGGVDMDVPTSFSTPSAAPPLPARPVPGTNSELIEIEDDVDDDLREALEASNANSGAAARDAAATMAAANVGNAGYEDDEALARRLQEEFYGGGTGVGETNGVRAPMARTVETLVDEDDYYSDPRRRASARRAAGGSSRSIFNQHTSSVWDESPVDRARLLVESTGGASEASAKSTKLAEMYRPPFEIMARMNLDEARDEAKESEKWILVNIQDNSLFACQTLNRDIWKHPEVMATIKENFLFLQMERHGLDGKDYIRYYLQKAADPSARFDPTIANLFPHIAIIDPRTGEQVKVWNSAPKEPMDFVMQLHEFLERYSLRVDAKNPVQRTSKPKANVEHMTEDEMMQLAMENSLGSGAITDHDPDTLTKHDDDELMEVGGDSSDKGKGVAEEPSLFEQIRADRHHAEPPPGPETTRIQFKMHDGTRVVRRFLLKDHVERLFEYVKADMLPEQEAKKPAEERSTKAKDFDLVGLGKKLIDHLDQTVDEAGLKMGTVMVEVMDE